MVGMVNEGPPETNKEQNSVQRHGRWNVRSSSLMLRVDCNDSDADTLNKH